MTRKLLLPGFLFLLLAAAPAQNLTPDELVRRGNEAFARGDRDAADRLYSAAEERTADPGLVAFNRAAAAFEAGNFREAEGLYLRALADPAIPSERRAKALFNRGVCLLKAGGDAKVYRAAIACYEACLEESPSDAAFAADARHNLEVAKLLWNRERAKSRKPPTPSDGVAEENPAKPAKPEKSGNETGTSTQGDPAKPNGQATPTPGTEGSKTQEPHTTTQKVAGAGSLQVIVDSDAPQPLSEADTRAMLQRAEERLIKDRRATARLVAGPERANVRDW